MKSLKLEIFSTPQEKKRGLLDRERIRLNEMFLLPGVDTIHTRGMKFPIKVIFVDEKANIKSIVLMQPGREYQERGAKGAIEVHPFFNSASINEFKDKIIKAL